MAATGFGAVAPGPPAATAPTAIDAPAIRIVASDASRSPGRARHMGLSAPGRRAPSPRRTQVPRRERRRRRSEGSRRGLRASTARQASPRKPRRSSKAWTFLSLARPITVTSSCLRPRFVPAQTREHRPREHRRREQDPRPGAIAAPRSCGTLIAGAPPSTGRHPSDWPCSTRWRTNASPRPRQQRRCIRHGMRDQSRVIVRADPSITARD